MKKTIMSLLILAMSISSTQYISALSPVMNDSVPTENRMNKLQAKRETLKREIKEQDAKRNRQIEGVSPETMERINDKQDSLCLALRSELVDVNLEIMEISPTINSVEFVNQYNNLIMRQDSISQTQPQR